MASKSFHAVASNLSVINEDNLGEEGSRGWGEMVE